MITLDQWKQSAVFEPDNPGQQIQEHYTGLPGGYSSFYWNRVPTQAVLQGLSDSARAGQIKTGLFVIGAILAIGTGLSWLRSRK